MISDWEKAIEFVLEMEGGYTLDADDPGGETKYGISKKAYPNLDIKTLTITEAKTIYENDYWKPCKCDELPTSFAISVFDTAVNQGVYTAIKLLQKTLGVKDDGIIGPVTIAAAVNATPRSVKLFLANRLAAYAKLMASNQNLLVFATNWSFRVISLSELILK
jgi:lysozyme family protein